MENKHSFLTHWIFFEYRSVNKSLPIYRVIFSLVVLLTLVPRHLWINNFPDTFFLPPIGVTFFFSGFPDITFFYLLNFLLILSLVSLLFGYKTFYSSIAVGVLFFIGNAWSYSFGKINHDILLIIIPLLLAFSCWDKKLLNDSKLTNFHSWPISTFALLISLAMFSAALAKAISGWLDLSTSALASHLVRNYFITERETYLASFLINQNSLFLFKFLDYSTIIVEAAFLFTLFSLKKFRLICAFACLFHFGVFVVMGISFIQNILAYALFVNWALLYQFHSADKFLRFFSNISSNINFYQLLLLSLVIWIIYSFFGNPFTSNMGFTERGLDIPALIILGISIVISTYYIVGLSFKKNPKYV